MTTVNGDGLAGLIPERVDSGTMAHTVQHSVCHKRQFEVDPFRESQPVQYREGIGHVVVATQSEHQTSCSVEYGLKASLEIGRKSDKHKVAVIEPGVDERDHEGTEAVVGDVAT